MSIITLTDLANYTDVPVTEPERTKYQAIIDNAESVVKSILGYDPAVTAYNETYYFEVPVKRVVLFNSPVVTLYGLSINGVPLTPSDATLDDSQGIVTLVQQPLCAFSLAIDYDAGFATIPKDIKDATAKLAVWDAGRMNSGDFGVRSKAVGDATTSFEIDIPINIKNQLQRFVRSRLFAKRPTKSLSFGVRP